MLEGKIDAVTLNTAYMQSAKEILIWEKQMYINMLVFFVYHKQEKKIHSCICYIAFILCTAFILQSIEKHYKALEGSTTQAEVKK